MHDLVLFKTGNLKEIRNLFFYLHSKSKIKSSKMKFSYIKLVEFSVLLLILHAPLFTL